MKLWVAGAMVLDAAIGIAPTVAAAQGAPIDVTGYGASGNAVWGATDCQASTTVTVICASETFTALDSGKTFILDDGAGFSSGHGVPLVTTIGTVTAGTGTITIMSPPTIATPVTHVTSFLVNSNTPNFQLGGTQTLTCTSPCSQPTGAPSATGTAAVLKVTAANITTHGSSTLHSGTCLETILDQTVLGGQRTTLTLTTASNGNLMSATVLNAGLVTSTTSSYSMNGYPETIMDCGFSTPAVVNLKYAVLLEQVTQEGIYSSGSPPCSATATATLTSSLAGTLVVTCPTNYNSTASWGTNNTCAFEQALAQMNANSLISSPRCLYFPAGNYLTNILNTQGASGAMGTTSATCPGTVANLAFKYGCFLGDEHNHSNIFVIPDTANDTTTHDLFTWLDSTMDGSKPVFANTQTFATPTTNIYKGNSAGSSFRNLTVVGDRSSVHDQNALSFYGPTTYLSVDNVGISYVRGHAFGAGYADINNNWGNIIESRISNTRLDHDGDGSTVPTLETTAENIEGSNNLDLVNLSIDHSFGPGIWLHQGNIAGNPPTRGFRILNTKIDGSAMSLLGATSIGDLFLLNDPAGTVTEGVDNILCQNLDLLNPPLGYAALHVAGRVSGDAMRVDCAGSIRSAFTTLSTSTTTANATLDYGRGLQIDFCTQCSFKEAANTTQDFNLLAGPLNATSSTCGTTTAAALGNPGLVYDGIGAENVLSTCLDPLSLNLISFPNRQLLANGSLANVTPATPIEQVTSSIVTNTMTPGTTLSLGGNISINLASPLWTVVRSGPTTAFTDTWDTATNLISQINAAASGYATAGQIYRLRICNQTSSTETLQGSSGVTLLGTTLVAAGSCTNFALEIVNTSSGSITIVGG